MTERVLVKPKDYQTARDRGIPLNLLDPNTQVEFRAIDIAICAMNMDPRFKSQFEERGTKLDEVLSGVHDLDSLFSVVAINCGQEMIDEGHIKNWGRNIMRIAENGYGTNGNGEVHKKLREFVLSDSHHFGIEISE